VRRSGRIAWSVCGYLYNIDDVIERYRSGNDFFFRNRGGAHLQGVEVAMHTPRPSWRPAARPS